MAFNPGSNSIATATDVTLSSPVANDVLTYDSGAAKWKNAAPAAGGSGTYTNVAVVVASSDAPAAVKASADFVCDGTADQTEINAAIDKAAPLNARNANMPAGAQQRGTVQLTGGRFNISAPILCRTAVTVRGMGFGTEVRAVANNGTGVFTLAAPSDHLCMITDLYIEGNYGSGGTCNAIDFDMTSSGSTSTYPSSSPDSYHYIKDLFINGFSGGTRHGVYLHAASTANNRGNIVTGLQVRNISGNGIYFVSASDSFISNCHVGTVAGCGYRIETGNTKVFGCKSFYCDTYGFYFSSGRHTCGTLESQDDQAGFYLSSTDATFTGLCADTSSDDGIVVANSGQVIEGFSVFQRSGGRFTTQTNGLRFTAAHADTICVGRVDPAGLTNKVSGAPGARSFMRVTDGSTLLSVG